MRKELEEKSETPKCKKMMANATRGGERERDREKVKKVYNRKHDDNSAV
jgi:hypothetical protein